MAGKIFKGTLLVSLMLIMAIGAPAMTNAQTGDMGDGMSFDQFDGMLGALPSIFGSMGGAGQVIGQIFALLVDQFMNISQTQVIPGLFLLYANGSYSQDVNNFTAGDKQIRTYYPDYDCYEEMEQWIEGNHTQGADEYAGYPYCIVNRTVSADTTVTKSGGISVTIGIWDNDKSLVTTMQKVIDTVKNVYTTMEESGSESSAFQEVLSSAVSTVIYLLIHINDIITGDELIFFNPITYENTRVQGSFGESHTWYIDVWNETSHQNEREILNPTIVTDMYNWGVNNNNQFMQWLAGSSIPDGPQDTSYGSFSFDLVQLWLKRFYVSIDVAEIVKLINNEDSSGFNPAKILHDLDIDFYLIWHHFLGGLFYDDLNADQKIDINYVNATNGDGSTITTENGTAVQRLNSSEVTHFMGLKAIKGGVDWQSPSVSGSSVSWGVIFNTPEIFWTPIGMDPEDRSRTANFAELDYISLGFTFTPGADFAIPNMDGSDSGIVGKDANVKLDQAFGEWNETPSSIDPSLNGKDFSIVYVSTLLHVHFTGKLLEKAAATTNSAEQTATWNEGSSNVVNSYANNKLTFGREAAEGTAKIPMVGRVDIAGPGYNMCEFGTTTWHNQLPASTQIIPAALFTMDAQAGMDYGDTTSGFTASASLGLEFSVMLYSVNYPEFSTYPGGEIVHDPTFSIFMTFEAQTYWAVILLVGVVALVGVAAILITRSKSNR